MKNPQIGDGVTRRRARHSGRTPPPQLRIFSGSFLSPHLLDVGSGYSSAAALPADTERSPLTSARTSKVEVSAEDRDSTLFITNVVPVVPREVCKKVCVFSC